MDFEKTGICFSKDICYSLEAESIFPITHISELFDRDRPGFATRVKLCIGTVYCGFVVGSHVIPILYWLSRGIKLTFSVTDHDHVFIVNFRKERKTRIFQKGRGYWSAWVDGADIGHRPDELDAEEVDRLREMMTDYLEKKGSLEAQEIVEG